MPRPSCRNRESLAEETVERLLVQNAAAGSVDHPAGRLRLLAFLAEFLRIEKGDLLRGLSKRFLGIDGRLVRHVLLVRFHLHSFHLSDVFQLYQA